jgi:formylglycine-generating enzyme
VWVLRQKEITMTRQPFVQRFGPQSAAAAVSIRLLVFLLVLAIAANAEADVFNMPVGQTSLQLVSIGNPGNANDPTTGYGGVAYNYSIGKFDVTVGQYTAFLNALAATDTYSLYNPSMATNLNIAGIARSGSSGSYTYSVIGSANHPITYVSWGDAARFANWLSNNQPTGLQNASTTEDGAYFLNGETTDTALNAVTRKATATWVIPMENEWYKAAFYNPAINNYYQYPYSSNTVPTSAPPGNTPNTGNFYVTSYAITGSSSYSSTQNYLTDVGAYTASASPYGAFDMGGDVFQWNEALIGGSFRGARGGSWNDYISHNLPSSTRDYTHPSYENVDVGFRVVEVPEPSTLLLAVLAFGVLSAVRLRKSQ